MQAITNIKHGNEDGSVTEWEAGEDVDEGDFTDEQWEALVAAGAVGEAVPEELRDKLTALEAEVESLRSQIASQSTAPAGGVLSALENADQLPNADTGPAPTDPLNPPEPAPGNKGEESAEEETPTTESWEEPTPQ